MFFSIGDYGEPGERGLDGPDGIPGEPGARGMVGSQGLPGITGEDGGIGAPGKCTSFNFSIFYIPKIFLFLLCFLVFGLNVVSQL